jgi:hypothetical protein
MVIWESFEDSERRLRGLEGSSEDNSFLAHGDTEMELYLAGAGSGLGLVSQYGPDNLYGKCCKPLILSRGHL